jgi:hypothetical protein
VPPLDNGGGTGRLLAAGLLPLRLPRVNSRLQSPAGFTTFGAFVKCSFRLYPLDRPVLESVEPGVIGLGAALSLARWHRDPRTNERCCVRLSNCSSVRRLLLSAARVPAISPEVPGSCGS